MSNKKNKINNPLSGITTKSLIITLVMILLFIACGFGMGYGVRGCVDQRENQAVTAYAEASSFTEELYTTFEFNMFYADLAQYILRLCKVRFSVLNHSLEVYPDNLLVPFSILFLNPQASDNGLSWLSNDLSTAVPYSDIVAGFNATYGYPYWNGVSNVASASTLRASYSLTGELSSSWTFVRCEYSLLAPTETGALNGLWLRFYYDNNSYITVVFSFIGSIVEPDSYSRNNSLMPNGVFYNTSETGLTAEAYERGKLVGMADTEDLVREARLEGYNNGKAEGEDIGYQRGLEETLEDISPFNVIVSGVNSFLRTEILPGVQLTIILSVGFGLLLLGFAIKIFLGG